MEKDMPASYVARYSSIRCSEMFSPRQFTFQSEGRFIVLFHQLHSVNPKHGLANVKCSILFSPYLIQLVGRSRTNGSTGEHNILVYDILHLINEQSCQRSVCYVQYQATLLACPPVVNPATSVRLVGIIKKIPMQCAYISYIMVLKFLKCSICHNACKSANYS